MDILVKNVGVDSGTILLCDINYYNKYIDIDISLDPILTKIINIKSGIYKVYWAIEKTWKGNGIVKIESGKLVISDPCYCVDEHWDLWLADTDYGRKLPKDVILIDKMGGDGTYNIKLKIEENI